MSNFRTIKISKGTTQSGYAGIITGIITNLQIVLNTQKNPYLNQATRKNTCQNFLPRNFLRSSVSLEIRSTGVTLPPPPPGLSLSRLELTRFKHSYKVKGNIFVTWVIYISLKLDEIARVIKQPTSGRLSSPASCFEIGLWLKQTVSRSQISKCHSHVQARLKLGKLYILRKLNVVTIMWCSLITRMNCLRANIEKERKNLKRSQRVVAKFEGSSIVRDITVYNVFCIHESVRKMLDVLICIQKLWHLQ